MRRFCETLTLLLIAAVVINCGAKKNKKKNDDGDSDGRGTFLAMYMIGLDLEAADDHTGPYKNEAGAASDDLREIAKAYDRLSDEEKGNLADAGTKVVPNLPVYPHFSSAFWMMATTSI